MMDILPTHYALSEAFIVIAAAFAVARIWPVDRWFAVGLAVVALAALVAIVRILGGLTGDTIVLHEFLSRYGALFGLGCMVGALIGQRPWLPPLFAVIAAALGMALPTANLLVLAGLILGGAALTYRNAPDRKVLAAGSFAFLSIAGLASAPFRSEYPALGWHIFHSVVAVWYVLVAILVTGALLPRGDGVSR